MVDDTSGTAAGSGFDDVGTFNTMGTYRANKLALTKQYVAGTGDPRENLGHAVELRLTSCVLGSAIPERAAELESWGAPPGVVGFFGTWHIRTRNYKGDAEMCLWLPAVPVVAGYVIQQQHIPSAQPVAVAEAVAPRLNPCRQEQSTVSPLLATPVTATAIGSVQ